MKKLIYDSPDVNEDEKTSYKRILQQPKLQHPKNNVMCYRTNKGDLCQKCLLNEYAIIRSTVYPSGWFSVPIGHRFDEFGRIVEGRYKNTYKCTDCNEEYEELMLNGDVIKCEKIN